MTPRAGEAKVKNSIGTQSGAGEVGLGAGERAPPRGEERTKTTTQHHRTRPRVKTRHLVHQLDRYTITH